MGLVIDELATKTATKLNDRVTKKNETTGSKIAAHHRIVTARKPPFVILSEVETSSSSESIRILKLKANHSDFCDVQHEVLGCEETNAPATGNIYPVIGVPLTRERIDPFSSPELYDTPFVCILFIEDPLPKKKNYIY